MREYWGLTFAAALAWGVALTSGAEAQSTEPKGPLQSLPTENVIVSAPKLAPESSLHDFIQSYTARSPASGKMARWKAGVCPIATGLPQAGNKFVTERVKQVAGMIGAPVGEAACKSNIDIVFTLRPQVLLDGVRDKNHVLLGYHDAAEEAQLATVSHPVQAWYTTQTVDLNGMTYVDDKLRNNGGFYIMRPPFPPVFVPDAPAIHVTGSHLGDGLSSELYHVIVIVDLAKVQGQTVGSLADYVAMLSLAQTQAFEVCEPVASIANLESSGCNGDVKASEITENDLAYLHGLYSIDPRNSFASQRDEIAYQMKKGPEKQ